LSGLSSAWMRVRLVGADRWRGGALRCGRCIGGGAEVVPMGLCLGRLRVCCGVAAGGDGRGVLRGVEVCGRCGGLRFPCAWLPFSVGCLAG